MTKGFTAITMSDKRLLQSTTGITKYDIYYKVVITSFHHYFLQLFSFTILLQFFIGHDLH